MTLRGFRNVKYYKRFIRTCKEPKDVIIMIELALAWQVMAGIKTDAMTITIMHVVSRIFMVLGGSQFYYIAGCAVFLMFSKRGTRTPVVQTQGETLAITHL